MGRAEQESTARIRRETLTGLLDTMAPTDKQPITARVRISDVQAEAARELSVTLANPAQTALCGGEVTKIIEVSQIRDALNAVEESKAAKMARLAAELEQLEQLDVAQRVVAPMRSTAERVTRLIEELKEIAAAEPVVARTWAAKASHAERVTRLIEELKEIEAAEPVVTQTRSAAVTVMRFIEELKEIEAAGPVVARAWSAEAPHAERVTRLIEELNEIEAAQPVVTPTRSAAVRVTRLIEELKQIAAAQPIVANVAHATRNAAHTSNVEGATSPTNATTRADDSERASDRRLFNDVDWDDILGAAVSAMAAPSLMQPSSGQAAQPSSPQAERAPTWTKRASKAPFSHIAALLPRAPMPTRAHARAKTNTAGLPPAERKAVQLIADVREKLESAAQLDAMGERLAFPTLSPRVAAELSGEEIAMLPMEIRLMLPEMAFPRIAMTPLPGADMCIAIHSTPCKELGHALRVSETTDVEANTMWPVLTLVAYFTAACLAGFGAVYCLA
jgi:hypothetical protein